MLGDVVSMGKKRKRGEEPPRADDTSISDSEHKSIYRHLDWLRDDIKDLRVSFRWIVGILFAELLATLAILGEALR